MLNRLVTGQNPCNHRTQVPDLSALLMQTVVRMAVLFVLGWQGEQNCIKLLSL